MEPRFKTGRLGNSPRLPSGVSRRSLGRRKSSFFIDSSHNKIVYKGDVSFCAVVCNLGFDEETEGAPKPGDEICLEDAYNVKGDGFKPMTGWLILAIKNTIESNMVTMSLRMVAIAVMALKTFGDGLRRGSQSSEEYPKRPSICI